jgi:hypothetical protein
MTVSVPAVHTPVPTSTSPVDFDANADALFTSLPPAVDGMNLQNAENNALKSVVDTAAASASAAQGAAQAHAAAAAADAAAQPWASGATYAVGARAWCPLNGRSHRRTTAGAGTTQPSLDAANWRPLLLDAGTGLPRARPTLRTTLAASRALDPRFVFTRASAGTAIGPKGDMLTLAANQPRFAHDPLTGECLGLLIEPAATNLLLNSATLGTQSVTVTSQPYTLSFYGSGTVTLSGAADALATGSGVYPARTTLTFTPAAGTLTLTVSGSVQFANLEAGLYASSWVPTTGAAATRAAETATFSGAEFAKAYLSGRGTLHAELQVVGFTGNASAVHLWDNSTANSLRLHNLNATNVRGVLNLGGNVQALANLSGPAQPGTVYSMAVAYQANNVLMCMNGGAVAQDVSATVPTMDRITLGGNSVAFVLRSLAYWPHALAAAELQALTTTN